MAISAVSNIRPGLKSAAETPRPPSSLRSSSIRQSRALPESDIAAHLYRRIERRALFAAVFRATGEHSRSKSSARDVYRTTLATSCEDAFELEVVSNEDALLGSNKFATGWAPRVEFGLWRILSRPSIWMVELPPLQAALEGFFALGRHQPGLVTIKLIRVTARPSTPKDLMRSQSIISRNPSSAREAWQRELRGKGQPCFCQSGPFAVTGAELRCATLEGRGLDY